MLDSVARKRKREEKVSSRYTYSSSQTDKTINRKHSIT